MLLWTGRFFAGASALGIPQGDAVDADGLAAVPQAAQQRLHQARVAQEVLPLREIQVGGDDGVILRLRW